jgi:hypothetical protein
MQAESVAELVRLAGELREAGARPQRLGFARPARL